MMSEFPMDEYLSTLRVHGEFHNVGMPDKPMREIKAQAFLSNSCKTARRRWRRFIRMI